MSKDNQPPVSEENLKYKVFLFDDVLREELNLVSARRRVLFPRIVKRDPSPIAETAPRCLSAAWASDTDEPAKGEKDSDKAVTVQREIALDAHLAGLAFSGGGIRSASFAIGVLQGLASLKLLNWFDYLSTVSGGGYAGGWLAAWLYREGSPINVESQLDTSRIRQSKADRHFEKKPAAEEKKPAAEEKKPAADRAEWEKLSEKLVLDEEPEPVTHLRAYSSYLTPRGGLFSTDTWAMLAIYLRNVFINLLVLLPLLFSLVLFVRWIIEFYSWSLDPAERKEGSHEEMVLFFVFLGGLALGLFGLGYNARAIWGLRSTPRTFQMGPRKLFLGVVLPLMVAAALVAPSYQGALNFIRWMAEEILSWFGLGGTALGGQVSTARFLSPSCLLLHALLFGVPLCLFSLFQLLRRDLSSTAPKQRSAGMGLKEPFAAFCGGSVVGILIAVTYELLHITDERPWLRATIGPPLFLVDIVLGFTVLVALLGGRINELEREWWGRLAGRLLRGALLWLILVGVIVYGPAALIGLGALGAIAGSAAQAVLAAAWAAITGAGVQAGRSPKTGTGQGPSLLEWLSSLAPPVFLVGLLTVLSLVMPAALDVLARLVCPPSSAAPAESSSAGSTPASLGTTEQARQHPEAASKQGGSRLPSMPPVSATSRIIPSARQLVRDEGEDVQDRGSGFRRDSGPGWRVSLPIE